METAKEATQSWGVALLTCLMSCRAPRPEEITPTRRFGAEMASLGMELDDVVACVRISLDRALVALTDAAGGPFESPHELVVALAQPGARRTAVLAAVAAGDQLPSLYDGIVTPLRDAAVEGHAAWHAGIAFGNSQVEANSMLDHLLETFLDCFAQKRAQTVDERLRTRRFASGLIDAMHDDRQAGVEMGDALLKMLAHHLRANRRRMPPDTPSFLLDVLEELMWTSFHHFAAEVREDMRGGLDAEPVDTDHL